MLKILANTLTSNGLTIPFDVYIVPIVDLGAIEKKQKTVILEDGTEQTQEYYKVLMSFKAAKDTEFTQSIALDIDYYINRELDPAAVLDTQPSSVEDIMKYFESLFVDSLINDYSVPQENIEVL